MPRAGNCSAESRTLPYTDTRVGALAFSRRAGMMALWWKQASHAPRGGGGYREECNLSARSRVSGIRLCWGKCREPRR